MRPSAITTVTMNVAVIRHSMWTKNFRRYESDLLSYCHCDMFEDFAPCEEDDDDEYEDPYGDDSYAYDYYEGI